MPWVVVTIAVSLAAGFGAERRYRERASATARTMLKVLLYGFTPPVACAPVGAAVVMRLVLAPLLLLLLAAPFVDLPPAYLPAAATPAGLNGLTVAHAYGLDLRYAASSPAWTTGVGVAGMAALAPAL